MAQSMLAKVGLDISALDSAFKSHAHRGIGRYVRELKKYFDANSDSTSVSVRYFDYKSLQQEGRGPLRAASGLIEKLPFGKTTLRQQCLYPLQLRQAPFEKASAETFDILHFPAHMDPPAWGMKKYVVTVLDLIPLVCADLYKANKSGLRFRFARYLELQAIKNASLILNISENTARDVHNLLGIPWEKLVVTPLAVDAKFYSAASGSSAAERGRICAARYAIDADRPLVLYVGGIDPRKNYTLMLDAFKRVRDAAIQSAQPLPLLLMVGNISSDREYPRLCELIKQGDLQQDVKMLGFVEDEDLLLLYAMASVFFFPSLYEGFGLPPLEAMAAGIPVVSSNSSCMPEVLGDAAMMFDPKDADAAGRALWEVLNNRDLAQNLRQKGPQRASLFTWQKTGEATMKAYERLASAK